jgi:hypothetical protein
MLSFIYVLITEGPTYIRALFICLLKTFHVLVLKFNQISGALESLLALNNTCLSGCKNVALKAYELSDTLMARYM